MGNPINYWYQKYISLKAEMDKMKAGAVKGKIVESGYEDGSALLRAIIPDRGYDSGEWVKLIVIKED